jgi:hypothetical protein
VGVADDERDRMLEARVEGVERARGVVVCEAVAESTRSSRPRNSRAIPETREEAERARSSAWVCVLCSCEAVSGGTS